MTSLRMLGSVVLTAAVLMSGCTDARQSEQPPAEKPATSAADSGDTTDLTFRARVVLGSTNVGDRLTVIYAAKCPLVVDRLRVVGETLEIASHERTEGCTPSAQERTTHFEFDARQVPAVGKARRASLVSSSPAYTVAGDLRTSLA